MLTPRPLTEVRIIKRKVRENKMLVAAIITGLIGLAGGVLWLVTKLSSKGDYGYGEGNILGAVLFYVFGVIWFLTFLMALNWSWSTDTLTGYIYSADSRAGYITGHIRFSEQAGQDVQPSFCVKADSEPGKQIRELAGSGQKVRVNIPPYFYFANNPFACGTTDMTIEKVK